MIICENRIGCGQTHFTFSCNDVVLSPNGVINSDLFAKSRRERSGAFPKGICSLSQKAILKLYLTPRVFIFGDKHQPKRDGLTKKVMLNPLRRGFRIDGMLPKDWILLYSARLRRMELDDFGHWPSHKRWSLWRGALSSQYPHRCAQSPPQ